MLGGRDLLPAPNGFDLSFAQLEAKYTFCHRMALALDEDASRSGSEFFHLWRGICSVSQTAKNEMQARRSILADFRDISKGLKISLETIGSV